VLFLLQAHPALPPLPPSPTRRSSDLMAPSTGTRHTRQARRAADATVLKRSMMKSRRLRSSLARKLNRAPQSCSWTRDGLQKTKRSEEHTSELQSRENLVCRLLLEKKN